MTQHVQVALLYRKVCIPEQKTQLFVDTIVSIGMQLHHTMLQQEPQTTRAMVTITIAKILIILCHGVIQLIQTYPGIHVFNHRIVVEVSIRHFDCLAIRIVIQKKLLQ